MDSATSTASNQPPPPSGGEDSHTTTTTTMTTGALTAPLDSLRVSTPPVDDGDRDGDAEAGGGGDRDNGDDDIPGIKFVNYTDERRLESVMKLVGRDLSEPYSIFTYRYFLRQFPDLCILAVPTDGGDADGDSETDVEPIGCVVCKIDEEEEEERHERDDGGGCGGGEEEGMAIEEVDEEGGGKDGVVVDDDDANADRRGVGGDGGDDGGRGNARAAAASSEAAPASPSSSSRAAETQAAPPPRPRPAPPSASPKPKRLTGYMAMLAVSTSHRKSGIGTALVKRAVRRMKERGCESVALETEVSNEAAIRLYEDRLGFLREELLVRYYLNWGDAYRLRLWFD